MDVIFVLIGYIFNFAFYLYRLRCWNYGEVEGMDIGAFGRELGWVPLLEVSIGIMVVNSSLSF